MDLNNNEQVRGPQILDSWKSIAAYLGVSVRTAQKWEEFHGLPVERMVGTKGRVFARVEDLDRWRIQRGTPAAAASVRWVSVAAVTVFLLAVGAIIATLSTRSGKPAVIRARGNEVIAWDDHGRERWRYAMGYPYETPAERGTPELAPWLGDLDGDSRQESLFLYQSSTHSDDLLCLSEDGELRWKFTPGRRVVTATERFEANFTGRLFRVVDLGNNNRVIVFIAAHRPFYPAQVSMLSRDGKLMREYWHSGHLFEFLAADLQTTRRPTFYFGGISNGYNSGVMIALDPDTFGGASREEKPEYQLLDFEPPREIARMLIPRTRFSQSRDRYNAVSTIRVYGSSLSVNSLECASEQGSGPNVIFQFSPELKLESFSATDSYLNALKRAGIKFEGFSREDQAILRNIRYLSGPPALAASR